VAGEPDRLLVVNADDLGLHPDINRGIERAHSEGMVGSTSISAVGEAFDDAVEVCRRHPSLDVGVHLTLVEERPLSKPANLGPLVGSDGNFPGGYGDLVPRVLSGAVSVAAVRRELTAQVERVVQAGLRPSHIDGHQHVHILPRVWPVVLELAERFSIPWIRIPRFEPLAEGRPSVVVTAFRFGLNVLQSWRRRGGPGAPRSPDLTPALGFAGHLSAERILRALQHAPTGAIAELVTHPGVTSPELEARYRWGFDWSGESDALTDPELKLALQNAGFRLTTFSALTPTLAS
jgi:predicted glycoside hydrolase/deacetylase ChbG (UPF0249 family)